MSEKQLEESIRNFADAVVDGTAKVLAGDGNDKEYRLAETIAQFILSEFARREAVRVKLVEACTKYLDAMEHYGHPDKTDRLMQAALAANAELEGM